MSVNRFATAALALALCIACASAQVSLPSTGGQVLSTMGASSATLYPDVKGIEIVKIVLGPCTGLQIHTHNTTEQYIAGNNNANPIKVVYVTPMGKAVVSMVPAGKSAIVPASFIHYLINYSCETTTSYAILEAYADTQLVLPTLAAIPSTDFSVFSTSKPAPAKNMFFGTGSCNCKSG